MWTLLVAASLAQAPVLLRPDPAASGVWGTSTATDTLTLPGVPTPTVQAPIELHHGRFPHDDGVRLVSVAANPLPALAWLQPALVVEQVVTLDPIGTPTDLRLVRNDFLPLIGDLLSPAAPDLSPAAIARGPCHPLLFLSVLPADPMPVGATWGTGTTTCIRQPDVDGQHQVTCRVGGQWDDLGADHRQRGDLTLTVSPERVVTRCERKAVLQRTLQGPEGDLVYRTDTHEVYVASAPQAIGWRLTRKLGVLFAGLVLAAGAAWLARRR